MNITELPLHVVVKIFSYLQQRDLLVSVRETCKLWCSLSYERALWKCFDVRSYRECSVTTRSFLSVLASISNSVEHLYVDLEYLGIAAVLHNPVVCDDLKHFYIYCTAGSQLEDDIETIKEVELLVSRLPDLSKKYPNLKGLHVFGKIGLAEDISVLKTLFPRLEEIELEQFPNFDFFEEFFDNHTHLKSVSVRNSVIGSTALSSILTKIPNLKRLDLLNTSTTVYDFSFDEIDSEDFAISGLETLCLDGTPCSDKEFRSIVRKAPHLQHVSIIGCKKLTNCGVDSLAENCIGLKSLLINRQAYTECNITNAGLQRIGENCRDLRVLLANYCFEISNIGVEAIAQNCPKLTELSLSGSTALTDEAVLTVVNNCPQLQKLDCGHCIQLTSKCVNEILTKLYHINFLNLETCHRLTEICLGKLKHNENFGYETDVSQNVKDSPAECSTRIDGAGSEGHATGDTESGTLDTQEQVLTRLGHHCHLQDLNLAFCSKVTNNCLKEIASQCPDILKIDIQGCSMVTNAGIRYLTQRCSLLKSLVISGGSVSQTSRLTDDCLFHIANVCQNLEDLVIVKNHNITSDGVFQVIDKCPKIALVKVTVSKRSNIKPESLSNLASQIEGKLLCIKFVGDVEISIVKDPDQGFR